MAKNIVYIQANEKIAQSFQETFSERNIELIVAKSGEEALKIMSEQEIGLLLVDINIPDMRLSKLVEITSRDYPAVIMNVCVDVMNSLLITKLVNRHAIHKIYVAPWDVREMVEEIEESLDAAAISRDRIIHENALMRENEELQNTLQSLKESLKRQQFSYGKIRSLTDILFTETQQFQGGEEPSQAYLSQRKLVFDTFLRMQTTETLHAENLSETVKADLEKIRTAVPDLQVGEIACSLNKNASKVQVADVRFALWLLAYRAAYSGQSGPISVSTESLDAEEKSASVTVKIGGRAQKKIPFVEQYLSDILKMVAQNVICEESADQTVWTLVFILCSE